MAITGKKGTETFIDGFIREFQMLYSKYLKRVFDIVLSLIALMVTLPLLLPTSLLLFLQNKGPIFFYQKRPGYKEKPFRIIKFKTMSDQTDRDGNLLPDMLRITWMGKWIRKLSLDELPQLLNVLKGDMSLVGPRPLLFKYIPLYSKDQHRRHDVRPGITGWAQVNGRNAISWEKKFTYDLYYVEHLSLAFDLKIIGLSMIKVLKREGINQSDARPMQPFKGNAE